MDASPLRSRRQEKQGDAGWVFERDFWNLFLATATARRDGPGHLSTKYTHRAYMSVVFYFLFLGPGLGAVRELFS